VFIAFPVAPSAETAIGQIGIPGYEVELLDSPKELPA